MDLWRYVKKIRSIWIIRNDPKAILIVPDVSFKNKYLKEFPDLNPEQIKVPHNDFRGQEYTQVWIDELVNKETR